MFGELLKFPEHERTVLSIKKRQLYFNEIDIEKNPLNTNDSPLIHYLTPCMSFLITGCIRIAKAAKTNETIASIEKK